VRQQDGEYISAAVKQAKEKTPEVNPSVFDYLQRILLLEQKEEGTADFLLRFQQLTAPVMAKGLEDSVFYHYNRLISLNEVGGNPHAFGSSIEEFHHFNQLKLENYPLGALCSSTHDTKFSEDARVRLHALTEMPIQWHSFLALRKKIPSEIDRNAEYLLFQMVFALWPASEERLWACFQKALRQSGVHTSWQTPRASYELAARRFLQQFLLSTSWHKFFQKIEAIGFWSALSALVLKMGSCGIVDIYQANEKMHYCLMDPDNRQVCDFAAYAEALKKKSDLKLFITSRALHCRKRYKHLFLYGEYLPLKSSHYQIAFMRKWKDEIVLIAARRFFSENSCASQIDLPEEALGLTDVFTGHKFNGEKKTLFKTYPFVMLTKPF